MTVELLSGETYADPELIHTHLDRIQSVCLTAVSNVIFTSFSVCVFVCVTPCFVLQSTDLAIEASKDNLVSLTQMLLGDRSEVLLGDRSEGSRLTVVRYDWDLTRRTGLPFYHLETTRLDHVGSD